MARSFSPRLFGLLACLPILCAIAAPPAAAQRSGPYTVTGINLDGSTYDGMAVLQQVGVASFSVLWRVGGNDIRGVGMVAGHSFAVAYGPSGQPGLGIYQLRPDGTLVGTWTMVGANGTGSETLTPLPESAPAVPTPPEAATPRP